MEVYERIKKRRKELGLSADNVADALGVSRATIYRYESADIEKLPTTILEPLSKILHCSPAYLMGWSETAKKKSVAIKVLGRVAAGIPLEAIEDIIDTEEISEELARSGKFFGLQIHGDSMEPKISNGDIVIVRQQEDAETGDIVIALVNGDDATCKRLKKYHDGIELIATNPTYKSLFFTNEEIVNKPVRIIGKVIELRAKL